jgi:aquaporin rerated protein, other eukaryote
MFLMLTYGGAHVANLPNATVTTQSGEEFINTSNISFKAVSSGIGLIINIWIFFRVSGSVFNPAVSLALVIAGAITPLRGLLFSIAQLIGAICAAAIIDALMPGPLGCATRLGGGVNIAQGRTASNPNS